MSAFGAALANYEGKYYRANSHRPDGCDPAPPLELCPVPTTEQLRVLVDPILKVMTTISVYEVMGNSSQVVVVSDDSPLTVAFIAAQESRVTSCTIWSPSKRQFVGVMTISDYIRVLLHCSNNPDEVETIASLSVDQWRKLPEVSSNVPIHLVKGEVEEPLVNCVQRMIDSRVNRLPVFASAGVLPGQSTCQRDADGTAESLVALLTYGQILNYLSRAIFNDADSVKDSYGGVQLAFSPATQAVLGATPPLAVPNTGTGSSIPWGSVFDLPVGRLGFASLADSFIPNKVSMQHKVVDVLHLFIDERLHSVPIVDDRDIIIDIISRTDVMRLESGGMYDIQRTLAEALSFRVGGRVPVFSKNDPLRDVSLHFVQTGVQEMFCVDEQDAVIGQISIIEIVKCFFAMVVPGMACEETTET